MERYYVTAGIHPANLNNSIFNNFTFLKVGYKIKNVGDNKGYGMQIVFMNLYVAAWLFFPLKETKQPINGNP